MQGIVSGHFLVEFIRKLYTVSSNFGKFTPYDMIIFKVESSKGGGQTKKLHDIDKKWNNF